MDVYPRDRWCDSGKKMYHKFNVLFVGKGWFDVVHISNKKNNTI